MTKIALGASGCVAALQVGETVVELLVEDALLPAAERAPGIVARVPRSLDALTNMRPTLKRPFGLPSCRATMSGTPPTSCAQRAAIDAAARARHAV